MWICLLIGVFFILIGLAVHVFRWHFLISGYNTMSKEKKTNVDIEGLGRLMGIYLYLNGGVFIMLGLLNSLGLKSALTIAILFLGISTAYLLITARKFDKNVYDNSDTYQVWKWVITLAIVFVLLFFSTRQAKVSIVEEGVRIHGLYGDTYTWESIKTVSLEDKLPTIERRTNGSAVGSNLKGHFMTTELGNVKLFVNVKKTPFIYLETDKGITIFNMEEADKTREIFREILSNKE
ncbi:MAG: DUF3784 domain-containing protein [Firmicutes bacterium]|nr:DUF3784 domain-containing protein [Bacillota bacterium]